MTHMELLRWAEGVPASGQNDSPLQLAIAAVAALIEADREYDEAQLHYLAVKTVEGGWDHDDFSGHKELYDRLRAAKARRDVALAAFGDPK